MITTDKPESIPGPNLDRDEDGYTLIGFIAQYCPSWREHHTAGREGTEFVGETKTWIEGGGGMERVIDEAKELVYGRGFTASGFFGSNLERSDLTGDQFCAMDFRDFKIDGQEYFPIAHSCGRIGNNIVRRIRIKKYEPNALSPPDAIFLKDQKTMSNAETKTKPHKKRGRVPKERNEARAALVEIYQDGIPKTEPLSVVLKLISRKTGVSFETIRRAIEDLIADGTWPSPN